jgi:hypothetical protein
MRTLFQPDLDTLVQALTDKGYHDADAEFTLRNTEAHAPFRLDFSYRVKPDGSRTYCHVRHYNLQSDLGREPDFDDAIAEARRQIAELPTQREQQIKDFVNQMEAIKATAEDIGVEGDFVAPIVELMKKLASNALPKPRQ